MAEENARMTGEDENEIDLDGDDSVEADDTGESLKERKESGDNNQTSSTQESPFAEPAATEPTNEKESPLDRAVEELSNHHAQERSDRAQSPSNSKNVPMKERLRLLKQKMNQARQLNRQAVQEEGQKAQAASISTRNHADNKTKTRKLDPLTQQGAAQVLYDARQASEKEALNAYEVNDYHNPQGQFRNYERNLRSLPSAQGSSTALPNQNETTSSFDPTAIATTGGAAVAAEQDGARRLAKEMHRRIEKKQKRELKRKQKEMQEDEDADVSHINQRNKRFNQKINRNYDKATAEIRQNLERGTAL